MLGTGTGSLEVNYSVLVPSKVPLLIVTLHVNGYGLGVGESLAPSADYVT